MGMAVKQVFGFGWTLRWEKEALLRRTVAISWHELHKELDLY
jgi:hypothetical protein